MRKASKEEAFLFSVLTLIMSAGIGYITIVYVMGFTEPVLKHLFFVSMYVLLFALFICGCFYAKAISRIKEYKAEQIWFQLFRDFIDEEEQKKFDDTFGKYKVTLLSLIHI